MTGSIDKYYLTASGLDGGVTATGHVGAFAVANFRFDISALKSWQHGNTKPNVGSPTPEPLVVSLENAQPYGFVQAITQLEIIPHLRLQGVTSGANGRHTVYDLRLDQVVVRKLKDTDGVDHLEFVYKAMSLTTRDRISADGTLGPPQTFGWDLTAGTALTNPLAAAVAGPSGGGAPRFYYLKMEGLDGGERLPKGYEGAFKVTGFSFDIGSSSHWTSGGLRVGNPVAAPLVIGVEAGDPSDFIRYVTEKRLFSRVRLEGTIGSSIDTVYDLRLQDASISKVACTGGQVLLELAYRAVSLTTRDWNPDDPVLGASETTGWDTAAETTFTTPLPAAHASTVGSPSSATIAGDYFLTVSGLDGEVTQAGYVGAFAVAHFRFDIDALVSGTLNQVPGTPKPTPLRIDLKAGGRQGGFLPDITVGKSRVVRLEGATGSTHTADSGVLQTIYDLRLEGVLVSKFTHTRTVDHLELVYKAMSLTTWDVQRDGSRVFPQTIAWDVVTGATSRTFVTNPANALAAAVAGMTLIGDASDNTLAGGVANDAFDGKAGADDMFGGGGNDVYHVDNAGDRVNEAIGGGTDAVWTEVSYALQAGQEVEFLRAHAGATGLILTGNALDNGLIGGAGNDSLIGGAGSDHLSGHDGDDLITGGAGGDRLTGGLGNDTFAWTVAADGGDTVTDFHSGGDRLQFRAAAFGMTSLNGSNFVAGSSPQAQGNGPTFLMNTGNHNLYFDSDGAGSAGPVLIAHLSANAVASDFHFV